MGAGRQIGGQPADLDAESAAARAGTDPAPEYSIAMRGRNMTSNATPRASGAWARAAELARRTPDARNRYVDFLRALSIGAVVFGHWLIAAPHMSGGAIATGNMLEIQPFTQWLTWGFQVMPIFFLVGGYSNGASWGAALREGTSYSEWLTARLRRLVGPVLPLLVLWCGVAVLARWLGVPTAEVSAASQLALVPIWFLAVYAFVAVLVPLTHAFWQRFGFASYALLVAAAVLVDLAIYAGGAPRLLGWANYAFVWLAVHQLGYAWRDARMGLGLSLAFFGVGLAAAAALVAFGPYGLSMVGAPGEEFGNTLPPSIALLALGACQSGLVLALERPARRWLARSRAWTLTVLVNGMIMTVYLWHVTALVGVIALSVYGLGGFGLELAPGSGAWWATRPLWMAVLLLALLPLIPAFARYERPSPREPRPAIPAWRLVVGAALVCPGLALLAYGGIAGEGVTGLRVGALLLPFAGAALVETGPLARLSAGRRARAQAAD